MLHEQQRVDGQRVGVLAARGPLAGVVATGAVVEQPAEERDARPGAPQRDPLRGREEDAVARLELGLPAPEGRLVERRGAGAELALGEDRAVPRLERCERVPGPADRADPGRGADHEEHQRGRERGPAPPGAGGWRSHLAARGQEMQVVGERLGGRVALRGVERQRAAAHDVPAGRQRGAARRGQRRGVAARVARDQLGEGPGLDGEGARHRLVDDAAQGVDVGQLLVRRPPGHELGRHVERRAHELARAREALVQVTPGQAEVGQPRMTVVADQHVRGLDVAVHDAPLVQRRQRAGDLSREPRRLGRVEGPEPEQGLEALSLDQLHDEEGGAQMLAVVVDGDHAAHAGVGRHLGLAREARRGRVRGGREQLQGHGPVEPLIARPEHRAHAAAPERRLDEVAVGDQVAGLGQRRAPRRGARVGARRVVAPPELRVDRLPVEHQLRRGVVLVVGPDHGPTMAAAAARGPGPAPP